MRVLAGGMRILGVAFANRHNAVVTACASGFHFWPLPPSGATESVYTPCWLHPERNAAVHLTQDDQVGLFGEQLLDLANAWEGFGDPHSSEVPARVVARPRPGTLLAHDGRRLFVFWEGECRLVGLPSCQTEIVYHVGETDIATLSQDGTVLAATSHDSKDVMLLCADTGEPLACLEHPHPLRHLALAPDGRTLATLTRHPGKVRVWDLASGSCVAEFNPLRKRGTALVYHPSGRLVATADDSGEIRFYDTVHGREAGRFNWDVGALRGLAMAPDGLTAAVASDRGAVLWDLDDLLPF